jgi:hypothetical protein
MASELRCSSSPLPEFLYRNMGELFRDECTRKFVVKIFIPYCMLKILNPAMDKLLSDVGEGTVSRVNNKNNDWE